MQIGPQNRAGTGYNDTYLRSSLGEANPDDPAAPESRLRGLIDWHYETVVGQSFYQLKAGRSVMFNSGRELVPPTDVKEGDVFGILISPTATAQRIELSARNFGGIDAYPQRRYIRATTLVLEWTLLEEIVDPDTGDVQKYFGYTTIQQTQPGTVIYRGDWSGTAYYIVGDQVNYQGGLYLRIEEGGDAGVFNPDNWIGGGSGTPGTGTARDPFKVGDVESITKAVLDPSNTWVDGDLTAYGSADLQNAAAPPADPDGQHASVLVGTADVATMDEFDMRDASGYAWRFRYSRRNNGTSGWTRIAKTA